MFIVVMDIFGTLRTIDTNGVWREVRWNLTGGPAMPWAANVPLDAIILAEMLPPGTIDAYLADVTTGLPVLSQVS